MVESNGNLPSVSVILLVLCSCNSVRMSLKSIKGNLLTYLLTFYYFQKFTSLAVKLLPNVIAYPGAALGGGSKGPDPPAPTKATCGNFRPHIRSAFDNAGRLLIAYLSLRVN